MFFLKKEIELILVLKCIYKEYMDPRLREDEGNDVFFILAKAGIHVF
jgi:hypothetical protein